MAEYILVNPMCEVKINKIINVKFKKLGYQIFGLSMWMAQWAFLTYVFHFVDAVDVIAVLVFASFGLLGVLAVFQNIQSYRPQMFVLFSSVAGLYVSASCSSCDDHGKVNGAIYMLVSIAIALIGFICTAIARKFISVEKPPQCNESESVSIHGIKIFEDLKAELVNIREEIGRLHQSSVLIRLDEASKTFVSFFENNGFSIEKNNNKYTASYGNAKVVLEMDEYTKGILALSLNGGNFKSMYVSQCTSYFRGISYPLINEINDIAELRSEIVKSKRYLYSPPQLNYFVAVDGGSQAEEYSTFGELLECIYPTKI